MAMNNLGRALACAAVLTLVAGSGIASAQTVAVRNVPPGSNVEIFMNSATVGSGKADASGDAIIKTTARQGKPETTVRVFLHLCKDVRRVFLIEPGLQPPAPADDCEQKEISGLYVVRATTTFVIDAGAPAPVLWLSQGPAPREWLSHGPVTARASITVPNGLALFAGGGFSKYGNVVDQACGNTTSCSGKTFKLAYTAGVTVWFNRYVGAEAGYVRPAKMTVSGSGDTFRFSSVLDPQFVTILGKVGGAVGAVRIYAAGGATYHQATRTTTETIDDKTITLEDGTTKTIPGGTQTFELKTQGWGWQVGGGMEAWLSRYFGIYLEGSFSTLKGNAIDGGLGALNERLFNVVGGARLHIGRGPKKEQ